MTKLLRAGGALAIAILSSCGNGSSTTARSDEPATASATQPLALTTDTAGLAPTTTAQGTAVRLEGRFENAVIARRNADGSITTECHDNQQEAEAFMRSAAAEPEVR
jgi:hypothetical protein